jgi:Tol biopolymer transport system component
VFTKFAPPRPPTLMASVLVDGQWSAPTALPFSGMYRDLDPAFSPDGTRLYFSSGRPSGPSAADTTSGVDTWYVTRLSNRWSTPNRLPEPVNGNDTDMYPSTTNRGVLYFDSFRSRPSRRLVYRAEPRSDGTLGEPQALSPTINADSGASNLFVDADERYVVFGAVRPEGAGGMDLYISWKTAGGWSVPVNLGPGVNTPATEFCPFVSRDGRSLYFTRVSTLAGKGVERNVYVVRFDASRYPRDGRSSKGFDADSKPALPRITRIAVETARIRPR